MITGAKVHIFQQIELIYTKKLWSIFLLSFEKQQIVEQINQSNSSNSLIVSTYPTYNSLLQREVEFNPC